MSLPEFEEYERQHMAKNAWYVSEQIAERIMRSRAVVTSRHEFRLLPRNLTFYTYFIFSKHDQRRPNNKFEKGK